MKNEWHKILSRPCLNLLSVRITVTIAFHQEFRICSALDNWYNNLILLNAYKNNKSHIYWLNN